MIKQPKDKLKSVVRYALAHFLGFWVIFNLCVVVPYIVSFNRLGPYLFNTDKTPVTIQQYFLRQNTHPELILFFIDAFLVELVYVYLFKRHQYGKFVISSLLISLFTMSLPVIMHRADSFFNLFDYVVPLVVTLIYIVVYSCLREYIYQRSYLKDVKLQQSQTELNALKAQVNPHFLFNCLNYLYGTALIEKATDTAEGIDQLAEMMRYSISGMHINEVPVDAEIGFIKNYINLQLKRLPATENIKIKTTLTAPPHGLYMAPMLLIPFIENAFKYGISNSDQCEVAIVIDFKDEQLLLDVQNTINTAGTAHTGNNTGIMNTIKRLELLYPGRYSLKQTNADNRYHIALQINLT